MLKVDITSNWYVSQVMDKIDDVNKDCENRSGKVVAKEARKIVVVRTGELRGSIAQEGGIITALAGHAKFVELGTHKMKAQPFLRPALVNKSGKILAIFKEEFE